MLVRFVRLIFAELGGTGSTTHPLGGWENRSLIGSIRRVSLVFAALWQIPMILSTFGAIGTEGWPLAAAQVCVALVAILALTHRAFDPLIPLLMAATGLWAYLAGGSIDSTLAFSACWQINFASFVVGLLVLRWYALPLVAVYTVVISLGLILLRPEWGLQFPLSIFLTQMSIIVALKWGIGRLVRVADAADSAAADAADAHQRIAVAEHVSTQLAEESRVLHDTAINTLGAIANGGAGTADVGQVREQCDRDVALLTTLRSQGSYLTPSTLGEIFDQPGLPLRRSGSDDAALEACEQQLPSSTVTAIVRCVREAVTNATKHSGAVDIEIGALVTATTLTVSIRDSGVGFDTGSTAQGTGISTSILGRANDNGIHAAIDSSPGAGTTVTLAVPMHRETTEAEREIAQAGPSTDALHLRAGELWGIGVTVVSIVLTAAGGTNQHFALFPMIAIMLAAWSSYRYAPRLRERPVFIAVLALCAGGVFVLSTVATEFGTVGAIHWQALAPTGPFVLLLSLTQKRWVRVAAAAFWILVVVTLAVSLAPISATAAQIILVAGGVGLGFSGVWALFQGLVQRLGRQAEESRRDAIESTLRVELDTATQNGYRRWVGAGLDSAITLLLEIAQQRRDPLSTDTRGACADEEQYLRQIIQISPRLIHLSGELPQTLSLAREHNVQYLLRLGEADAPDAETALSIVASIRDVLSGLEPGDKLQASLYPISDGLQLTLIGPGISHLVSARDGTRRESLGQVDLVEMEYRHTEREALAA